jgi:tRNA-dihydrouridine synthase B
VTADLPLNTSMNGCSHHPLSPFAQPFLIGGVCIPNRVVLAPMAGLTISAYRRHLRLHGVGLVTTEMVSAYGLVYGNVRTVEYLDFAEEERPLAVQLFGDSPDIMAQAAERVLSRDRVADVLDINMGCPVRKVVRTGAGSALLGDHDRAVAVAMAVVRMAAPFGVPVTVKLRSGLRAGETGGVVDLARRLEEVGVAAVGLHPRTADQFYRGEADHTITAKVVEGLGIPVVASGDIRSHVSARTVLERTGATAVMLARGAAGDPWSVGALLSGMDTPRPALDVVIADLRALLTRVAEERGSQRAARWSRKLLGWYLRPSGVPAFLIEKLRRLPDVDALDRALAEIADGMADGRLGSH